MSGSSSRLTVFSQDDIDNERVLYEHFEQEQFADSFRFDVSCGSERQRDLEFGFDILPAMIPMQVTGNLTVPYAGSVTLTSSLLRVTGEQFQVRKTYSPQVFFAILMIFDKCYLLCDSTHSVILPVCLYVFPFVSIRPSESCS